VPRDQGVRERIRWYASYTHTSQIKSWITGQGPHLGMFTNWHTVHSEVMTLKYSRIWSTVIAQPACGNYGNHIEASWWLSWCGKELISVVNVCASIPLSAHEHDCMCHTSLIDHESPLLNVPHANCRWSYTFAIRSTLQLPEVLMSIWSLTPCI
jgi:hypothetical protein